MRRPASALSAGARRAGARMTGYRKRALTILEAVWPAAKHGPHSENQIRVQIDTLRLSDADFVEPDRDDFEDRPHRDEVWA